MEHNEFATIAMLVEIWCRTRSAGIRSQIARDIHSILAASGCTRFDSGFFPPELRQELQEIAAAAT